MHDAFEHPDTMMSRYLPRPVHPVASPGGVATCEEGRRHIGVAAASAGDAVARPGAVGPGPTAGRGCGCGCGGPGHAQPHPLPGARLQRPGRLLRHGHPRRHLDGAQGARRAAVRAPRCGTSAVRASNTPTEGTVRFVDGPLLLLWWWCCWACRPCARPVCPRCSRTAAAG